MGLYYYRFDWTYVFVLLGLLLSGVASFYLNSVYARYSKIRNQRNINGVSAANIFLTNNNVRQVSVTQTPGMLTDHFDPRSNVVRLSPDIYGGTSIASVAVAAHECGHVMQYEKGYFPISIRNTILPMAQLGSTIAFPMIFLGLFFSAFRFLVPIGIIIFSAVVLFQIITLPVEINASRRGLQLLRDNAVLTEAEMPAARKVLTAAALTYVAAALSTFLQLVRLIILANNSRD